MLRVPSLTPRHRSAGIAPIHSVQSEMRKKQFNLLAYAVHDLQTSLAGSHSCVSRPSAMPRRGQCGGKRQSRRRRPGRG